MTMPTTPAATIRRTVVAALTGMALAATMAAPSLAQEPVNPPMSVEPSTVEAPGAAEFRVSGEAWDYPVVGIIPCAYPESGRIDDIDPVTCSIGQIVDVVPEDGAFDVTVVYEVREEGLAIVVSSQDPGPSAGSAVLIPIGEAPETELANTGYRTNLVLGIALALTAIGIAARALRRRVTA